jgi:hypothetical protein
MKTIRINVTKIDKSAIYEGKNGKYVDLVMFENREGEDQYGNLGFVTQGIGKERRLAGERGPIIGNWKEIGAPSQPPAGRYENTAAVAAGNPTEGDDDIPF